MGETWATSLNDVEGLLYGYKSYQSPAYKFHNYGRSMGGVVVFIKEKLTKFIKKVYDNYENALFILFDRTLFHVNKDILYSYAYIPPENSPYYSRKEEKNGIVMFQDFLNDIMGKQNSDLYLILTGDFNSRVGTEMDYIPNDDLKHLPIGEHYDTDNFEVERKSKDSYVNKFGRELISMCCSFCVHILNGRVKPDRNGEYTFVSPLGKSVIDYFMVSSQLFEFCTEFLISDNDESSHFPIICKIASLENYNHSLNNEQNGGNKWVRYKWKEQYQDNFIDKLYSDFATKSLQEFLQLITEHDISEAADKLVNILQYAGENMICKDKVFKQSVWWDEACEILKKHKYMLLNIARQTDNTDDWTRYKKARQDFKNMCNNKKEEQLTKQVNSVCDETCTQELWSKIKTLNGRNNNNNISSDEWYNYFKTLLNEAKFDADPEFKVDVNDTLSDFTNQDDTRVEELDRDITLAEIKSAMKTMKNKKAPGPDGIEIQFFKNLPDDILAYIVLLFNNILLLGKFPQSWCKSIICPIYKKGSINNPENFRGISLLDVIGKIFNKLLSERLTKWADEEHRLYEQQAGYRRKYSTIDNCFSLYALTQKYLSKQKGRLYCIFIDFAKAFDCVQHDILFYVLIRNNISSRVIRVLQSMYSQVQSCVKAGDGLSEYFECTIGTKQGCMLSPFLFVMFLNDFIKLLNSSDCKGIYVDENSPNVMQFLFADDMANVADTVINLQRQINVLSDFCKKYGMSVNLDKTKIVVFRRGGPIRKIERWYFNNEQIQTVSCYKYLGMSILLHHYHGGNQNTFYHSKQKRLYLLFINLFNNIRYQLSRLFIFLIIWFCQFFPMGQNSGDMRFANLSKMFKTSFVKDC